MSVPEEFSFRPEEFSGVARLFPLPDLVLFPHVMQPLRIFEPRYRELLEDALDDDGLIAMALLKPGWELDYEGQPPLERVVCLGRVLTHCRLPEGHYNIFLLGLQRAAICRELPLKRAFRRAQVQLLPDRVPGSGVPRAAGLRRQLLSLFRRLIPAEGGLQEDLEALVHRQLSLSALTDIVAFTAGLDVQQKQQLLGLCDVGQRARLLLSYLKGLEREHVEADLPEMAFPPQFSRN